MPEPKDLYEKVADVLLRQSGSDENGRPFVEVDPNQDFFEATRVKFRDMTPGSTEFADDSE